MPIRALTVQLTVAAAIVSSAPALARAHFVLRAPACYSEQSDLGTPIKSAPCGQADPGDPVQPTGSVTTYVEGQTVMVEVEEIIFHPGHFRVAIAADMDSLPADPPVTPGIMACGTTEIDPTPALPVLADGALVHDAATSGPQVIAVQLPPGFTCDRCVLQVTQFMSAHGLNDPGGCFYHHCADVTVVAAGTDAGVSSDGGTGGVDGSMTPPGSDSGCGCRVTSPRSPQGSFVLAVAVVCLIALGARRTRR